MLALSSLNQIVILWPGGTTWYGSPSQNFHTSVLFKILIHYFVFILSMYLTCHRYLLWNSCQMAVCCNYTFGQQVQWSQSVVPQPGWLLSGLVSFAHCLCSVLLLRFILTTMSSKFSVCVTLIQYTDWQQLAGTLQLLMLYTGAALMACVPASLSNPILVDRWEETWEMSKFRSWCRENVPQKGQH